MFDFNFEELTQNGLLNEWYAIPVLILLIVFKVFAEKKYEENLDKTKKNKDKKDEN